MLVSYSSRSSDVSLPSLCAKKCGVKASQSWDRIILFESQDEADALDKFFQWFDEFQAFHEKASPKPKRTSRSA